MTDNAHFLIERLDALRTELSDLAFTLECRGRLDAADVANSVAARVGEFCEEFSALRLEPAPGSDNELTPR